MDTIFHDKMRVLEELLFFYNEDILGEKNIVFK